MQYCLLSPITLLLLIPSTLLTTLIFLYLHLHVEQPTKQVHHIIMVSPEILENLMQEGETILLLNSKGDWEYAPSAKRDAQVKF